MPSVKITLELTVRCDNPTAEYLLAGENIGKVVEAMTQDGNCKAATFYAWKINPQTNRLDIDVFWGLDNNGQLIELEPPSEGAGDDALFGMRGKHPSLGLAAAKELKSSQKEKNLPEVPTSVLNDRKRGRVKTSTKIPGDHSKDPIASKRVVTENEVKQQKKRGIYEKFVVNRTDGSSAPGKKHENCQYFVLDLTHDPIARRVLFSYAMICASTNFQLYNDLCRMLENLKNVE